MNFIKLSFLALAAPLFFNSSNAATKKNSEPTFEFCISSMNQRSDMLIAQDWEPLEKNAQNFISKCKGVIDDEAFSYAYFQISVSKNQKEKYSEGLDAAQSCIDAYYGNVSCHVQKALSLKGLNRIQEAKKSLVSAINLTESNIRKIKRDQNSGKSLESKETLEARLEENISALDYARALYDQIP